MYSGDNQKKINSVCPAFQKREVHQNILVHSEIRPCSKQRNRTTDFLLNQGIP